MYERAALTLSSPHESLLKVDSSLSSAVRKSSAAVNVSSSSGIQSVRTAGSKSKSMTSIVGIPI